MGQVLNVGIASYGLSGQVFHGPFLKRHTGFNIVSILERSKQLSRKDFPKAEIVTSYEELLENNSIDLIVVNTPTQLHYSMALAALKAGKHVVLEKPFTVKYKEAKELVEFAKSKNLVLAVYHNRRLESGFKTMKALLDNNKVGTPTYFKSHFNRDKASIGPKKWKENNTEGAGIFYDLAPHLLDQAIHLFGKPDKVSAQLEKQRPSTQVIDYFLIQLIYDSGLLVELEAGMYIRKSEPKYLLKGTEGTYVKEKEDHQEELLRKGIHPSSTDPDAGFILDNLNKKTTVINKEGSYQDFYNNLFDAIVNGKELLIKKEEALYVMKIMEEILSSTKISY